MKSIFVLFISIAIIVCVGNAKAQDPVPHVEYYCSSGWSIDSSFSSAERSNVLLAFADVNEFMGDGKLVHEGRGTCSIRLTQSLSDGNKAFTHLENNILYIDVAARNLEKDCGKYADKSDACFQAVIQHELGHSIGLRHHKNSDTVGIMSEAPSSWKFTDSDLLLCKTTHPCQDLSKR